MYKLVTSRHCHYIRLFEAGVRYLFFTPGIGVDECGGSLGFGDDADSFHEDWGLRVGWQRKVARAVNLLDYG